MFMCCSKQSSDINSNYSGQQLFSYTRVTKKVKGCEYNHASIKNLESSAKVLSGLASHQSYIKEGHLTDIEDRVVLKGRLHKR